MRTAILAVKRSLHLPVEASVISPDKLRGKSKEEIEKIRIWEGNTQVAMSEIFRVSEKSDGSGDELTIKITGDASKVRRIGYGISVGSIIVEGNAGMYVGEDMSGGSIVVVGSADSWLGMNMKGGQIEVKGNGGDYVGAGYRGTTLGMQAGSIVIHGNAGNEAGCWMTGGTIKIKGKAGLYPGVHMSNGAILVEGDCDGRAGAQMRGGKIIVGGRLPSILPSFTFEEIQERVKFGEERIIGPFYAFSGDMNEDGKGRLSTSVNKNPHLKWYEKYLES